MIQRNQDNSLYIGIGSCDGRANISNLVKDTS